MAIQFCAGDSAGVLSLSVYMRLMINGWACNLFCKEGFSIIGSIHDLLPAGSMHCMENACTCSHHVLMLHELIVYVSTAGTIFMQVVLIHQFITTKGLVS